MAMEAKRLQELEKARLETERDKQRLMEKKQSQEQGDEGMTTMKVEEQTSVQEASTMHVEAGSCSHHGKRIWDQALSVVIVDEDDIASGGGTLACRRMNRLWCSSRMFIWFRFGFIPKQLKDKGVVEMDSLDAFSTVRLQQPGPDAEIDALEAALEHVLADDFGATTASTDESGPLLQGGAATLKDVALKQDAAEMAIALEQEDGPFSA
eukprot:5108617-Amphidinium_carterae.1